MVKYIKTWISSEGNITSLQNKNLLKGYLGYKTITSQNVPSKASQNVPSVAQVKNFFVS